MPDSKITARYSLVILAEKAQERLHSARRIADACRHDRALHRAAMRAVFVLEDTFFALHQVADAAQSGAVPAARPLKGGEL